MYYYEVAPTKIVRSGTDTYTYSAAAELAIGQLVMVEIGKTVATGIVIQAVAKPAYETKPIQQVIDEPPLPRELLTSLLWLRDYYVTPLATVLRTALPQGITKRRRTPYEPTGVLSKRPPIEKLTSEQTLAIEKLDALSSGTTLLHGVTGSGKTMVYIDQIKKTLEAGRSAIVLVPEIALTSQLLDYLAQHIGNRIIVTHSRQSEAERHSIWQYCLRTSEPHVIVGPRSTLFMPLKNIGVIVVDEMHEPSFKQEQSPRYSALRLASILGRHHKAKVIFGSATPPVSEYYLATSTNQLIISMQKPARKNTVRPDITLVDMTKRTNFSRHRFLSNKLIVQMEQTLASHKQVLVFHNRRGSAPTTLCENCGWQAGCPRCFVPLTLHSDKHELRCHICGFTDRVPTSCPVCHQTAILHKGIGTKLIESELSKLFPKAVIARFDGDTDDATSLDRRYQELFEGSIDIIIGTQAIAKGFDLPHLRTVAVIQADAGLTLPDFAAPERTFQLLAQVVGRVGRSSHATDVIIQSYQPEHPSVQLGIHQNYDEFYRRTIALRQKTLYPPFIFLLKLTCVYKTEAAAIRNARILAKSLQDKLPAHVTILGPAPAFYERKHDTYRWQLTLKSHTRADLVAALAHLPSSHWQFELDPTSLL